ncbi:SPOSA6832_02317 [Sporobolomyces salmonicolor]|uniref:SPOSA6832_02317-mRNA-1:cds n=1 Tax=Sporidiobolus salmonicolor TaxID=5005 RepID=A0A0D6ELU8_SPOSA|nr:SPOSA6832_02317 [Sporobolomyces salmonicolor]
MPMEGSDRRWFRRLSLSPRTILFSILFLTVALLLGLLFHPSSLYAHPVSHASSDYYASSGLSIGLFSPASGELAANPLEKGSTYAGVPFAKVGGSLDQEGKTPTWAGGDAGAKELEENLGEGGGRRWNGTHWWDPTVILLSMDGMRADYLTRGLTPHLLNISRKGVRAEYLKPVFPTLTFPNHWSLLYVSFILISPPCRFPPRPFTHSPLATGLYPSSHGIVSNDFWSPAMEKEFVYTEPAQSWESGWWGGEPIWATAVKSALRSAVLMWPGPPKLADGTKPTLWYPFVDHYHYRKKLARLAGWLDMPYHKRPHLMTVYLPEVDVAGHRTGPDSKGVNKTLSAMDEFARQVMELVDSRGLGEVVNVVVVGDHGMTDTNNDRLVFLDEILGEQGFAAVERNEGLPFLPFPLPSLSFFLSSLPHLSSNAHPVSTPLVHAGWPSAGLRFKPEVDPSAMLSILKAAAAQPNSGFDVYTQETMPEKWHFTGNERIAPIYCVPWPGWAITSRHELEVEMGGKYKVKGYVPRLASVPPIEVPFTSPFPLLRARRNHGYDNDDPSMRTIFVAHGPFANQLKTSQRLRQRQEEASIPSDPNTMILPGFANLEVYDLVARLLGIPEERRALNNGTSGFWERYLDDEEQEEGA